MRAPTATSPRSRHAQSSRGLGWSPVDRDLHEAGRLAFAAARDDLGVGAHVEERQQPGKGGGVEAAQWIANRLADRTEYGRAEVDVGGPPPQLRDRAAPLI